MFLFFQAEDGIRDWSVTGVQTCALFFSSRRRHTRLVSDWSSDVCSSDLQREYRTFRAAELFPDCSKANEFSLRQVFSEFARKIRNRARRPRSPESHLLPPCPSRRPAVRRPAVCSSSRCRGLPAEDRAELPKMPGRFFSVIIRVARGSRNEARQGRRRSSTASGRARGEQSFRSGFREPARPLLPAGRGL